MKYCMMVFFLFLSMAALHAQSDTITANPKAVQLRRIWVKIGVQEQEGVGTAVANCGDIDGDSLGDFAVRNAGNWCFYHGTRGTLPDTPFFIYPDAARLLVTGNWFGTGHKAIAIEVPRLSGNGVALFRLYIHRTENGRLDSVPDVVLDGHGEQCISQALSADLDEDGADELILTGGCEEYKPVIWIYHGGPAFDASNPTCKVNDPDTLRLENVVAQAADLDGDKHLDLITVGDYRGHDYLKIYWGDGSMAAMTRAPQVIELPHRGILSLRSILIADLDGDKVPDILLPGPDDGYLYLYRTNATGKNARTRTFQVADADKRYKIFASAYNLGHMRDTADQYNVLGLAPKDLYCLTGGAAGPNNTWDAAYTYPNGGAFRYVAPLFDVDGDGWDDLAASNDGYGDFNRGIAAVYAGGPYIPTDDPTVDVHQEAITGRPRAISIWPNPVASQLNIAWRGDLPDMPRAFEIHNAAGERITAGEVKIGAGSAVWNSSAVPAGTYFLSIYSNSHTLLATIPFVKQ